MLSSSAADGVSHVEREEEQSFDALSQWNTQLSQSDKADFSSPAPPAGKINSPILIPDTQSITSSSAASSNSSSSSSSPSIPPNYDSISPSSSPACSSSFISVDSHVSPTTILASESQKSIMLPCLTDDKLSPLIKPISPINHHHSSSSSSASSTGSLAHAAESVSSSSSLASRDDSSGSSSRLRQGLTLHTPSAPRTRSRKSQQVYTPSTCSQLINLIRSGEIRSQGQLPWLLKQQEQHLQKTIEVNGLPSHPSDKSDSDLSSLSLPRPVSPNSKLRNKRQLSSSSSVLPNVSASQSSAGASQGKAKKKHRSSFPDLISHLDTDSLRNTDTTGSGIVYPAAPKTASITVPSSSRSSSRDPIESALPDLDDLGTSSVFPTVPAHLQAVQSSRRPSPTEIVRRDSVWSSSTSHVPPESAQLFDRIGDALRQSSDDLCRHQVGGSPSPAFPLRTTAQ